MNDKLALFGFATTPLELVSFALAATTVMLNIRQNHWAWLFSIASSATYAVVFFDARLYGDSGLQLVFIAASVWGWWQWLRGTGETRLVVTRLGRAGWAWALAGWGAAFLALSWFLQNYTNTDVPHMDGFLTAGSLVGQLLLARKKVENWHVWIVVDVLYVGLYIVKDLHVTAVLYAVFVVLAARGLRAWSNIAQPKGLA
ncbi:MULTISPECIES: nicotinamide riboside transporter PnuC [unclassified Massilia]|uniref:nicotinamide riboside transporter PnuC n=1 Tax=unclassified Massilia TaxID=2609279 RepID=UPI001784B96D|nr:MULTISPECIES: nicotinamide riboside transporter PnuC [unclassified Massilia]MBD8532444.1 nicotinamide mononucleotide transporter [Massilia sp. CFBP 13647]MBD8675814.1 nicotinamide mononucleotide transporter [Massilia sp. CFBP 13721]